MDKYRVDIDKNYRVLDFYSLADFKYHNEL